MRGKLRRLMIAALDEQLFRFLSFSAILPDIKAPAHLLIVDVGATSKPF
jgi:hypothetical protein